MSRLTPTPLALGIALKRWRLLHRVKQTHAAEIFGVAQSTISRWEAGLQEMAPAERAKVERLLAARFESATDRALERLVTESPREVHLVCDFTHRLLACSSSRGAQFSVPVVTLLGRSLWRYATPEIMTKELETLLQHNQGKNPENFDYEFNLGYGRKYTDATALFKALREMLDDETRHHMKKESRTMSG
ncbi:helix-turn-helix transcriptional regulator [Paraburkholderia sediminicola]|uniref:helix-turn-helix domain-containing protein n=1 Tax=Paraburkholderia sediminicola TaxID=458836 RepID=UPI0038BC71E7